MSDPSGRLAGANRNGVQQVNENLPAVPAGPTVQYVVNIGEIPPQKSAGAAVALTLLFGPLGAFYVSGKFGLWSLVICVVAAVLTLGVSILFQIFILPIIAMSEVQKSNAKRAALLSAAQR
jgi:hypothetical protein